MEEKNLTHFDEKGNARMVDVSQKAITTRTALAQGSIYVSPEIMEAVCSKSLKKGDVLAVAQVAGIMAVKQTANLIPMCHTLLIEKCSLEFLISREEGKITAFCKVKTQGKTGVEMEALTGVSGALLTIYDMCKALDKGMCIGDIHLVEKTGGKSGDFHYNDHIEKSSGKDEEL